MVFRDSIGLLLSLFTTSIAAIPIITTKINTADYSGGDNASDLPGAELAYYTGESALVDTFCNM